MQAATTPTNKEIADAMRVLISLHHDWGRGTAYVSVKFEKDNNAAIAEARRILRELDKQKDANHDQ